MWSNEVVHRAYICFIRAFAADDCLAKTLGALLCASRTNAVPAVGTSDECVILFDAVRMVDAKHADALLCLQSYHLFCEISTCGNLACDNEIGKAATEDSAVFAHFSFGNLRFCRAVVEVLRIRAGQMDWMVVRDVR